MGFGEDQVGLSGFWGQIPSFRGFSSVFWGDPTLFRGVFDVFWDLHGVLLSSQWVLWWLGMDYAFF